MEQENRDYVKKIEDLLSNYEDGWDVFKKADDWDYNLTKKPEAEDKPNLPESWLELADEVIRIIAHDKYELSTYPNVIEIIDSDRMLDAYTKVGMPISYDHWSFGKNRMAQQQAYDKGRMGLAYEIVINTNPAIAYCMEENTKTMQMMVVAHASYGHNSFFKNNHMFERFTQAKDILGHLLKLKNYVRECEDKYGYEEVEKVIDACHALETHGVDRYKKPQKRTPEEAKAKRERIEEARRQSVDRVMDTTLVKKKKVSQPFSVAAEEEPLVPKGGEENLLRYIATYAPHLPHWKRNIINMIADKAQYFYPQRQTQAMNEGWASFWHYTIMNDLYDLDLIDNGMMADFIKFHTNVLAQPDYDDKRFSGINPYFVGFRIYQDIKRICMEPTEEDKEWAPEIAGNGDWLNTLKEAMEDYKDESFFLQFLSPKLIRDLRLFALQNDSELSYYEITGIHNEKGYDHVRRVMASNYRLADNEPRIEVVDYNYRGDRTLTLLHSVYRGRPIEREDMSEILKHMYQLWEHPVVLESRDPDGKLVNGMSCPPGKAKPGSLEYSSEFGF